MKNYRRRISFLGALCLLLALLTGCKCEHEWIDATCTEPKICSKCEETDGVSLGHAWREATCTEAKTCRVCKVTEGEALGHDWKDATCTEPKTCTRCLTTEGNTLGHSTGDWTTLREATCTEAGIIESICAACGEAVTKETEMLSHTQGNG